MLVATKDLLSNFSTTGMGFQSIPRKWKTTYKSDTSRGTLKIKKPPRRFFLQGQTYLCRRGKNVNRDKTYCYQKSCLANAHFFVDRFFGGQNASQLQTWQSFYRHETNRRRRTVSPTSIFWWIGKHSIS